MCVEYGVMHVSAGTTESRRGCWIPLELGLQTVVSCPMWLQGSSVRALCTINHCAISSAPIYLDFVLRQGLTL